MGYSSGATTRNMRRYARDRADGEELPRMSPGVGCDSTAQGNKVTWLMDAANVNCLDGNVYVGN